jgi:hypothetical protein
VVRCDSLQTPIRVPAGLNPNPSQTAALVKAELVRAPVELN